MLYIAVNALVIPSRRDNLPNTGLEAQACGTPVLLSILMDLKISYFIKKRDI